MSRVYTGGTFDLFHAGHVNFLRQCKRMAADGTVTVALNTDEFVQRYKGVTPTLSYENRRQVLLGCRYVDTVIPNEDGEDSKPTILKVHPDILVIGSDWATRDYYAQMNFTQEWLDGQGITLAYVPYTEGISSSQVRKLLH